MPTVTESCQHCIVIRCMQFAPKITIRKKCTRCGQISINSWAPRQNYTPHPNALTIRYGLCPMGQKIVTEYMSACAKCADKEYRMRMKDSRAFDTQDWP